MALGGFQPSLVSYSNKRQKLDDMTSPICVKIDETHNLFPYDGRPYIESMDKTAFRARLDVKSELRYTHTARKESRKPVLNEIIASNLVPSPLCSPQLYLSDDDYRRRFSRQSSETPSFASMSSTFSSDAPIIRIRQPVAILPRTEANGIENEVLTIRHLSRLQPSTSAGTSTSTASISASNPIPVLSILRLLRDRTTRKLTAAILEKPTATPLSRVSWSATDVRHRHTTNQIVQAQYLLSTLRSSVHGPVASVAAGTGRPSWREAFLAMFDALLMDAEDSWANLPFARIRAAASQPWSVDERNARCVLVIPGFGEPRNVLVDEETGDIRAFVGFREAYWGDPEAVLVETKVPLYRIWQALRVVALASVRPEEGAGKGREVIEARQRLMVALQEIEGGVR